MLKGYYDKYVKRVLWKYKKFKKWSQFQLLVLLYLKCRRLDYEIGYIYIINSSGPN